MKEPMVVRYSLISQLGDFLVDGVLKEIKGRRNLGSSDARDIDVL
jgi:hypothetical protein